MTGQCILCGARGVHLHPDLHMCSRCFDDGALNPKHPTTCRDIQPNHPGAGRIVRKAIHDES